jgi:hypothetical protein
MPLQQVISIAGFCLISAMIQKEFILLPILLAMNFPAYPVESAFVGMVVSVIYGGLVRLIKPIK